MDLLKTGPTAVTMSQRNRRGAAAVEFALVVPLFVLLIFGMIEIGRGIMVNQILTNAAREGAREAILEGSTSDRVETVVHDYLTGTGISGGTVTVSPSPTSADARSPVTVSVSVPVSNVAWMASSTFFAHGSEFSATSTMLKEDE